MRIKSLNITGFGRLTNKSFRFAESFQVIKGFNESGKTTMVNAILGVLFGFKGRSEDIKKMKDIYQPWDEGTPYRAELVVNFGDHYDYCIERDFAEDWVKVQKYDGVQLLPSSTTAEELVREKMGISSGRLFQSTLLVKQEEVSDLHRTELNDAIMKKLTESGSGVSVKEIMQILGERLKELNRGFGRQSVSIGPIKKCKDDIKQLREELQEVANYFEEYSQLIEQLKEKQSLKDQLQARIERVGKLVFGYQSRLQTADKLKTVENRLQKLEQQLLQLSEKEAELAEIKTALEFYHLSEEHLNAENLQTLDFLDRKIVATEQRLEQLNLEYQKLNNKRQVLQREMGNHSKTIASYYSVRYNEDNLREVNRLQVTIASLQDELNEKRARLNNLSNYQGSKFSWTFWVGIGLCLCSSIGIFAGNIWGYVVFSVLLVSGIIIIYFGRINSGQSIAKQLEEIAQTEIGRVKNSMTTYERMLEGIVGDEDMESFEAKVQEQIQLKQRIQILEEEMRELSLEPLGAQMNGLQKELAGYLKQTGEILSHANVANIEEFRGRYEEVKELRARQKLVKDALEFLNSEGDSDQVANLVNSLSSERDELSRSIENHPILADQEFRNLQEEYDDLNGVLETAREEEIKIAAGVENYNRLVLQDRDLWTLETSLAEKERKLKQLETENQAVELAIQLLQEATTEARSRLAPQVKDKVIKIFQWVTRKRYRDVRVEMDNDQLVFQVMDDHYDRYRDVHYLSTGTRDQLYLALRIALGEYLTKCETFPVFLDDPFVNFDEERLTKTIEILRVLSREHQIIWLTKDFHMVDAIAEAAVTEL